MHEVGLMEETLAIALERARAAGARRVHSLTLRIGPLAGVETEALQLAFKVVTQGTFAEGATLDVESVSVQCWCQACACLFQPTDRIYRCPACAQLSSDVRQGCEFDLVAVEVS